MQIYQEAQTAFSYLLIACGAIAVIALAVCLTTYFAVRDGVMRPLAAMVHAMREVVEQKYETPIPSLGRGNEIGLLAGALEVFKTTGIERRRLIEQELCHAHNQREQQADILKREVGGFIASVRAV